MDVRHKESETQALIPFIWQFYLFIRAPRILDKFRNIILKTLLTLSPNAVTAHVES